MVLFKSHLYIKSVNTPLYLFNLFSFQSSYLSDCIPVDSHLIFPKENDYFICQHQNHLFICNEFGILLSQYSLPSFSAGIDSNNSNNSPPFSSLAPVCAVYSRNLFFSSFADNLFGFFVNTKSHCVIYFDLFSGKLLGEFLFPHNSISAFINNPTASPCFFSANSSSLHIWDRY